MIPRNVWNACMKERESSMLAGTAREIVYVTQEEFDEIDIELGRYVKDTWRVFPTLLGVPLKVIA